MREAIVNRWWAVREGAANLRDAMPALFLLLAIFIGLPAAIIAAVIGFGFGIHVGWNLL